MKRKDHPNYRRWLKPPTIEQIDAAVSKAGVCDAQFERFYNIYPGAIKRVRMGKRNMPVEHWHLFLDPAVLPGTRKGAKIAHLKRRAPSANKSTGELSRLVS